MKRLFFFLFLAASLAELYFIGIEAGFRFISKPMIMLSLIGYYFFTTGNEFKLVFFLGLCFALLGDIFLLGEGESEFIAGLVCFLLMQICYIRTFLWNGTRIRIFHTVGILSVLVYGFLLNIYIWPHADEMKVPVIFYSIAIVATISTAIMRSAQIPGYWITLGGVLLFVISDSMLALNRFVSSFDQAGFWIMMSYILAQWMIVKGQVIASPLQKH